MEFRTDGAGRFAFTVGESHEVHLFVRKEYRRWGLDRGSYDGICTSFGLGWLILVAWIVW